jgi:acyl-coenzyme A synthetase/AMP-(fatty) acid ligase
MRIAIGLEPTDRFWNMADPGWAYGLYYAVTGPLALGHATTFFEGSFSAPCLLSLALHVRAVGRRRAAGG